MPFDIPPCAVACAGLAAFLALSSCAAEEPEIAEIEARRLLIQDEAGGFSYALSVFALFSGGGAADDFAMMTVTHGESGISWEIPASSGLLFPAGSGYFWAGSSSLLPVPSIFAGSPSFAGAAGSAADSLLSEAEGFFPEGSYSVEADNAAGSSAYSSFALNEPFFFSGQSASFRLSGAGQDALWSVELSESIAAGDVSVYLFLLDEGGRPLCSIRVPQELFNGRRAEGQVSALAEAFGGRRGGGASFSDVSSICCYVEHVGSSSAVLLFPISLEHGG